MSVKAMTFIHPSLTERSRCGILEGLSKRVPCASGSVACNDTKPIADSEVERVPNWPLASSGPERGRALKPPRQLSNSWVSSDDFQLLESNLDASMSAGLAWCTSPRPGLEAGVHQSGSCEKPPTVLDPCKNLPTLANVFGSNTFEDASL